MQIAPNLIRDLLASHKLRSGSRPACLAGANIFRIPRLEDAGTLKASHPATGCLSLWRAHASAVLFAAIALLAAGPAFAEISRNYAPGGPGLLMKPDLEFLPGFPAFSLQSYHLPSGLLPKENALVSSGAVMGAEPGFSAVIATTSRLSPAAMLACEDSELRLFCGLNFQLRAPSVHGYMPEYIGPKKTEKPGVLTARPRFAAIAANGEVKVMTAPGEFSAAGMSENWMLVWFGSRTYVRGSPFPVPEGYFWGTSLPGPAMAYRDIPWLLVFERKPDSVELIEAEGYAQHGFDKWDWSDLPYNKAYMFIPVPHRSPQTAHPGMILRFNGQAGRVVLMPLFGSQFLSPVETEQWADELPPEVAARCRVWSRRLLAWPEHASENIAISENGDRFDATVSVRHVMIADEWNTKPLVEAPVRPIVFLCAKYGLPMEWSVEPLDSSLATYLGPYAVVPGVDSYKVAWQGFGKYWREKPAPRSLPDTPVAARVCERLQKEMEILISERWAPFHLMSGKQYRHTTRTYIPLRRFGFPADLPMAAGLALPFLEPGLAEKTIAYVHEQLAQRPLGSGEWIPPWHDSRSRVYFPVPAGYPESWGLESRAAQTPEDMYVFGAYCEDMGLSAKHIVGLARRAPDGPVDWATGFVEYETLEPDGFSTAFKGCGGEHDVNRRIMKHIGGARLALLSDDDEAVRIEAANLAFELMKRFALRKYVRYLYDSGLLTVEGLDEHYRKKIGAGPGRKNWAEFLGAYSTAPLLPADWQGPDDDLRVLTAFRNTDVGYYVHSVARIWNHGYTFAMFDGMTPELARFFRDHLLDDAQRFIARIDYRMPEWFLPYPPNQWADGEQSVMQPQNAREIFLARAWIIGEPGEKTARFLAEPWCRADLDYIEKLCAVLHGCAGLDWE